MKPVARMGVLLIALAAVAASCGAADAAAGALQLKQTWTGVVRDSALKALASQPAIVDKATLTRIWQGWGVAGAEPVVDFGKELVLIVFADGPNRPGVANAKVDEKGNVSILAMQTEMAGPGFGYALVLVDRAGIKSVEGKAIVFPAVALAPATERAAGAQPAEPLVGIVNGAAGGAATATVPFAVPEKALVAEQYDGYFVNNTFEPNNERSLVVATTQKEFDAHFGAGFVMNDRSHRLAAGVFDKQLVAGVVRRGPEMAAYKLAGASLANGVLTVKYQVSFPKGPGGATYATPLILSVAKEGVTSVKFFENGALVGTVNVAH